MADSPDIRDAETRSLQPVDWLIMVVLAGIALAIFAILFTHKFEGLRSNDQAHISQLARNLSRGEGFTTKALVPVDLAIDPRIEDHPDCWRDPLFPLMVCAVYLVTGAREHGGVLVSGLFFVLLAPLSYLFARNMCGRAAGISASLVTMILPQMWDYSLHALTEMPFAFMLAALLYALHAGASPMLTGIVFGLCYLTRHNAIVFLPVVIWYLVAVDARTRREMGRFAVGALAVALPWLVRNAVVTGNPLFSLQNFNLAMFTETYPGYTIYASFDRVNVFATLWEHPGEMFEKYTRGLNYLTGELVSLTHPLILLSFVGGALAFRAARRSRFLLYALLIMIMIQFHLVAASVSPVESLNRYFVPFIPVIVAFAVFALFQRLPMNPQLWALQVLMAVLVVVVIAISDDPGWNINYGAIRAIGEEEVEYIRRLEEGPVVTDQPWELAWKADRIAIWAPARYSDFQEHLSGARYAFFSGTLFEPSEATSYRREYIENPEFNDAFVLEKRFDGGGMLFVRR
ncbi:MAG: hypothetical protein Kow0099_28360 [Candidatus Abyssubacteria bacterium]